MKPNDLYKLPWTEGERTIFDSGILLEFGFIEYEPEILAKANWIQIRNHGYKQIDYRRYWQLASVWFMNKPVMIVQRAGREGDDFKERFITDLPLYWQMIAYLDTLRVFSERGVVDLVDPEKDIPRLTEFYGDSLW